jgi:hypothetical protein
MQRSAVLWILIITERLIEIGGMRLIAITTWTVNEQSIATIFYTARLHGTIAPLTPTATVPCICFATTKDLDPPFASLCAHRTCENRHPKPHLATTIAWVDERSSFEERNSTWMLARSCKTTSRLCALLYDYFIVVRAPVLLLPAIFRRTFVRLQVRAPVLLLPAIFRRTFVRLHYFLSFCINWDWLFQAA